MKKDTNLMKFSLLSVSLILTSSTAISAAIPQLSQSFSGYSLSSIELLTTIPSFMVMIFVLLSSFIARKIGQKQTIIIGLIITGVCGIIPVFVDNYMLLLISRAGLGIGFGLMNSLAVSMISSFYTGNERATLIGFQSAFQGLGAALLTFLAGYLLSFGWHYSFLVYALAFPILVLFMMFVPKPESYGSTVEEEAPQAFKTNKAIIGYAFFLIIACILYNAVFVKLATLLTTYHLGSETSASSIFSIMQLASMVTGFLFGIVQSRLHKYTLHTSLFLMGLGFFLISSISNLYVVAFGSILVGVSFSLFIPFLFNQVSILSPKKSETFNTSILLVGANIGSFLAPYGLLALSSIKTAEPMIAVFINGGTLLITLAILGLFLVRKIKA
ncbi:MFS transporter [Paenibacillus maysiensis]|uniref:MFS transporter n=1 Tax=Paenibacillus maysiensis TaxID=1155954 RepID=UPI0004702951|nr:MFS transporter [Paenibacillus maysiensis]